jgi:hypothetical protein
MEAKYHSRINSCSNQDEMVDYILSCIPIIREYTGVGESAESTVQVANLKVTGRRGVQRKDIYKKYLAEVENEHNEIARPGGVHDRPCPNCGVMYSRQLDEVASEEICLECGATEYVLSEEVGFKEEQEMEKHVAYSYKRENHFNEWISQFQAKESTSVPEEVYEKLRSEFKKCKIKDLSEITHEKVKALLKKLNYAKYYEHVPYITSILNGITPPTMPQELEDKLRLMFHKIQAPFEKHKPANRKNFLSYSYTLYKMVELLGFDEYLPCFPLLKSREKLYIQDQIWERICRELQWEFIKTQ